MSGQITIPRQQWPSLLAEGFHTSFRKGCENGQAVWEAISNLPADEYATAIEYLSWSLEYMGVVQWAEQESETHA